MSGHTITAWSSEHAHNSCLKPKVVFPHIQYLNGATVGNISRLCISRGSRPCIY